MYFVDQNHFFFLRNDIFVTKSARQTEQFQTESGKEGSFLNDTIERVQHQIKKLQNRMKKKKDKRKKRNY